VDTVREYGNGTTKAEGELRPQEVPVVRSKMKSHECGRSSPEGRRHKEKHGLVPTFPDWLAAEANGKTGKSSEVAPVFSCKRGNPQGSQTPGALLCFFLGRARKKKQQRKWQVIMWTH